jgi:hypothetical protein
MHILPCPAWYLHRSQALISLISSLIDISISLAISPSLYLLLYLNNNTDYREQLPSNKILQRTWKWQVSSSSLCPYLGNEAIRTHGVLFPTKCFQQCDTKAVDIAFSMLFGLRLEHTREPCIHFVRKIHEQIEFSIREKKGKTKKLDWIATYG